MKRILIRLLKAVIVIILLTIVAIPEFMYYIFRWILGGKEFPDTPYFIIWIIKILDI
jgi:hypothetical protein